MREEGDGLVEITLEDDEYMLVSNDEEAINEFHNNFTFKPPSGLKQRIFQKM